MARCVRLRANQGTGPRSPPRDSPTAGHVTGSLRSPTLGLQRSDLGFAVSRSYRTEKMSSLSLKHYFSLLLRARKKEIFSDNGALFLTSIFTSLFWVR